jgi:hypothetical protein
LCKTFSRPTGRYVINTYYVLPNIASVSYCYCACELNILGTHIEASVKLSRSGVLQRRRRGGCGGFDFRRRGGAPAAEMDNLSLSEVGLNFGASEWKIGGSVELTRAMGKNLKEGLGAGFNRGGELRCGSGAQRRAAMGCSRDGQQWVQALPVPCSVEQGHGRL